MTFAPTASQLQAITTINKPLAVTAGAGSGKTRVLVERYLNLLEHGITVDKIAAITFTKKAAQEMRDRLRQERPDLIESLEQAQISTIHSLCQRIIQEHPLQARIDPLFRVGEEWETQVLLKEIIAEVVESQEQPEELGTAVDLQELILGLYEEMRSKGDLNFNQVPKLQVTFADFPLQTLLTTVDKVLSLTPSTKVQGAALTELAEEWASLSDLLVYPDDDLRLEALDLILTIVKKIRGKLAEETQELRDLVEIAKQDINERKAQEIIAHLGGLLAEIHEQYGKQKNQLGILDYNDLEYLAYQLLQDPQVRANYPFAHLMVDEFQDTNPMQKKIIDALVAEGALLFVVGDPKQSIYRFRGADVGVFVDTKTEIARTGENIFLAENFRSKAELIEFSNAFFEQVMQDDPIGFEASIAGQESAGEPCVTILHTPSGDRNADEARVLEAQQIALQIQELVDSGKYQYKDISLLFRAMTKVYIYEQALKDLDIPYVNLGGRGFYSKQEIQDVMHYFRWLEDPADQVAHFAVLRSPFYLLSDQALYWLQVDRLDKLTAIELEALKRSQQDYTILQKKSLQNPAPKVITELLERTNYIEKTWRLPFGPQKVANVEKLLEQSWELFAKDLYTIVEQVRFLRLMVQDGQREGEALLDAEHANVVILRTIHGSKGLEFPVVFLPDTTGNLLRPQRGNVLYSPEFGLTYKGTNNFERLKEQEQIAEINEAKRLLYVAVTRAESEFYWCARDGRVNRNTWWSWLQNSLDCIPKHLYREVSGEKIMPEKVVKQIEPTSFKLPRYEPLVSQYHHVSFSVTSLMNYARCPRYYYLRYVLGMPEYTTPSSQAKGNGQSPELSAMERGNIVHRVCEQIEDPLELASLIDYAATMEGVVLNTKQKAELEKIITPYLASTFFQRVQEEEKTKHWMIFREHEFLVPTGQFVINGLVDQVFLSDEGLEVVDFKSNWIKPRQVESVGASYAVQLRLYAWAMAKIFGKPVLKSQAYFLIPNKIYAIQPNLLEVEQTEEWIKQTCATILTGAAAGSEAFPITADCTLCAQNSYCGNVRGFGKNSEEQMDRPEEER